MSVLTPIRNGGPYSWGSSLVTCLNGSNRHVASHLHEPFEVLSAPIISGADLIHTALPLSLRLWKKPVVLTVHGDYSVENNIWKPMYPWAVRMADAVTTPSRYLKERLGLDDAKVIPNAIFPERFRIRESRDSRTINLVTVTKFYFKDKAQGVLDLLRIVDQARTSFDGELKLTVVGGGKYLWPVIRKATAYDVNVRFTGFVNPLQELSAGDIFVYYSTHDNFPITFLEAMASGLPVVTNDVGAAQEIITDGSEGFIAGSNAEYADYLQRLLDNGNLRHKMGMQARKKVEEHFSWHAIAPKYISLYDSLRN